MSAPPAAPGEPTPRARFGAPGRAAPVTSRHAMVHSQRGRRGRVGMFLFATVLTLALVAALVVIGGAFLIRRYDGVFARDALLAPSARAAKDAGIVGPLNFLLIGSDYRSWSPDAGQRSDTIIIAHIPSTMDHVYLVSVPRDLRVDMPAVPSLNFGGATTKINSAFEFGHGGTGGMQLLSQTLTDLVGVRFDGAAVVSFTGLQKAVRVVGGVELCVDVRTVSEHTGHVFEPGCRLMNAADVLDYLRQRQFPDGDFTRQRHQQQFLKAFLDRMASSGVLTNPFRMDAMLRAVADAITVDTDGASLTDLAIALRGLRPDAVTGIRFPAHVEMIGNLSYVIGSAESEGLFHGIRSDTLGEWVKINKQWVNDI